MRLLFTVLTWMLLAGLSPAAEVGPICQWYRDPCTTMAIHWIEIVEEEGTGGEWQIGEAGFGFGDDDDRTVLADMQDAYRSVYIRRPFQLPAELPEDAELVLSMRYDDGFVAYLDGKEVARQGVEGVGAQVTSVESHEADTWERFSLGKAVAGAEGVIAIEGHNAKLESTDFTLRPRLDVKSGGKTAPVIRDGAKWAYLAGADPEPGWTTRVRPEGGSGDGDGVRYEVAIRPAGAAEWLPVALSTRILGASEHRVHTADLAGLRAGTRYEFRVTRGGAPWGTWEIQTAPAEFEDGLTFVTGGDMFHDRERLDAMNARAGKEDPLFALLGGDLAYANGENSARWLEWVDSWHQLAVAPDGRLIPMIVVIGNHEVKGYAFRPTDAPGRENAPYFYSLFLGQENGGQLAIEFGDYLSVVGLDSGHTENIANQSDWLERTLAERASIPRLFVCYHRPAWGTGVKGDATDIRTHWSPLFERYQVDAVFENDHHVYKRTHPIANGGQIDHEKGVIYLGDGSWGVNTRRIADNWREQRPFLAEARAVNHLIKVRLLATEFAYEARLADGTVIDGVKRPVRR